MAEEVHYDLGALLGLAVAAILAKFGDLSDNQLGLLAEAERAAEKPRSSLLAAVETEQAARAAQAKEGELAKAAELSAQQGAEVAAKVLGLGIAQSAIEGELKALVVALETENQRLILENERLDLLVLDLQEKLTEASDSAEVDAALLERSVARVVMVLCEDIERPVMVVFAGHGDLMLAELPGLGFMAQDFRRENGGITLLKPIDFPMHSPAGEVHSIWLIDPAHAPREDNSMAGFTCRLLRPLNIGGGRGAQIPAGHLHFTGADKAA